MHKAIVAMVLLFAPAAFAAVGPVERWEKAVGGKDKIAAIRTIYREGTLQFAGLEGTIKVWHTADGKYRKEEQVGMFSNTETFDGTDALMQRGNMPLRKVEGPELAVARSKSFSNSNAMFFVFFPERRHGNLTVEDDHTIAFTPENGIEWRVILDPQTSLPQTMIHKEGDKTITVTFTSYETVDGITFEKEIHRTMGDPRLDAVIHFNKTVINAPVEPSLFSTIHTASAPQP